MRVIDADALSELVREPIDVFLSRLDLKCPPIIDLEPCWIPCNMKLPNIGEPVLVTFDTEEVCEMKLWEIAGVEQYWCNPYDGYTYDFNRVIAWCEKPKPYKEVTE